MGDWENGRGVRSMFTTWAYGHLRRDVLDKLALSITRKRSYPVVAAADGPRSFRSYTVSDAFYGTGWFGTVKVRATERGKFRTTNVE